MVVWIATAVGQESSTSSASESVECEPIDCPPDPDVEPGLWIQLVQINQQHSEIDDLKATFVQNKYTVLLKQPMSSQGHVFMMAKRVLWQTQKPQPSTICTRDRELLIYYPQQKSAEIYPLTEQLAMFASSPMPPIDALVELFYISRIATQPLQTEQPTKAQDATTIDPLADPSFLAIRLTPRDEVLGDIEKIEILIDLDQSYARQITVTDINGDRTVTTFTDLQINTGLDPERLVLNLPEGTKVSRPLEALNPK